MKIKRWSAALTFGTLLTVPAVAGAAGGPPSYIAHDEPSCSLYPHRFGNGEYVFENKNHNGNWPIPITVWDAENKNIVYQGFLSTGNITPLLKLGPNSAIGWSNNYETGAWSTPASATYVLEDYEKVDWCGSPEPPTTTTTTQPTTTTTVPSTTTTAPPVAPTTTVPTAESTTTTVEPVGVAGVAVECAPHLDSDGVVRPRITAGPSGGEFCGDSTPVTVQKRSSMPVTGNSTTPWFVAVAVALLASGAGLVRKFRSAD